MGQVKRKTGVKKCYRSAVTLDSIIDYALRLEKEADEIQKEIVAGGITESTIRKQEEWKQKKRNLDKRKVNVLNEVIFPSMANLTVLLEAMANSGFIGHMFEGDLKALFFAKSTVSNNKNPIFGRLTDACCKMVIDKQDKDGRMAKMVLDESRLILCDIMQESIYRAILAIAPFKYEDQDFLQKTLYADMDRLHAWTTMLAKEASKNLAFEEDRRPALF